MPLQISLSLLSQKDLHRVQQHLSAFCRVQEARLHRRPLWPLIPPYSPLVKGGEVDYLHISLYCFLSFSYPLFPSSFNAFSSSSWVGVIPGYSTLPSQKDTPFPLLVLAM